MKKIKLLLFALTVLLLASTSVLAETRWTAIEPVKQSTSDGIDIEYQTKVEFKYDCWEQRGELICDPTSRVGVDITVDVTVTIPSDYNKDNIVIAPEVLQELARQNYEKLLLDENSEYLQLNNSLEPGDNIKVNLTNKNTFRTKVYSPEDGFKYFCLRNIETVKIISPESFKKKLKQILKENI